MFQKIGHNWSIYNVESLQQLQKNLKLFEDFCGGLCVFKVFQTIGHNWSIYNVESLQQLQKNLKLFEDFCGGLCVFKVFQKTWTCFLIHKRLSNNFRNIWSCLKIFDVVPMIFLFWKHNWTSNSFRKNWSCLKKIEKIHFLCSACRAVGSVLDVVAVQLEWRQSQLQRRWWLQGRWWQSRQGQHWWVRGGVPFPFFLTPSKNSLPRIAFAQEVEVDDPESSHPPASAPPAPGRGLFL